MLSYTRCTIYCEKFLTFGDICTSSYERFDSVNNKPKFPKAPFLFAVNSQVQLLQKQTSVRK